MDKKLFSIAAAYESMQQPQVEEELHEGRMKELHGYIEKGMSAKDIAKKMKLDVKTIQALMPSKKEEADPVEEKKMDPVGKADADIDNDGDVDKSDEYLHNRRKAIKKAMKKDETVKKEDTDIRDRLMSIWEDAAEITEADRAKHYKGATKPEPMNKVDADQKMYDAHQNPEKHGEIGKEADESGKAERSGPGGKSARTNDAKLGDKKIINQIANAYKTMKSGQDV